MAATKSKRKSRATQTTDANVNATREISPVKFIPLGLIDPPQANPRETFDDAEIQSLSDSISEVGLLQPVIVRPDGERFELVAGERRLRAVRLMKGETIAATIRNLGDREACEIRLLENLDRRSLSPWEEARGFSMLAALGHDAESLAKLVRIPADDVERRLKLCDLCEQNPFWREWLQADDPRRGPAAELLVEWLEFPTVLKAAEALADRWPVSLVQFRHDLTEILVRLSRDADPQSPVGPAFELTPKLERTLDVRPIRIGRKLQPRAFNVARFDELNDAVRESRPVAPTGVDSARNQTAPSTAPARAPAVEPPADSNREDDIDAESYDQQPVDRLRRLIEERIAAMERPELESLARFLGIDSGERVDNATP